MMRASLLFLSVAVAAAYTHAAHLVSIGDWGCSTQGGFSLNSSFMKQKKSVDAALQTYCDKHNLSTTTDGKKIVLSLGDNFYQCGVETAKDPQFDGAWRTYGALTRGSYLWMNVLGNHDYATNPDAQVQRGQIDPNWFLPARSWVHRLTFDDVNISVVGLDANPCLMRYRSNSSARWDPKSCESGVKNRFHENIVAQNCSDRVRFMKQAAAQLSLYPNDVRILMLHEPLTALDVDPALHPAIASANFHLSLAGHVHKFAIYHHSHAGKQANIISGAGCHDGLYAPEHKADRDDSDHIPYTWQNNPTGGFTSHIVTPRSIVTKFIDADLNVLHELKQTW